MSESTLPPRPSLDYLRKLAKERLVRLRTTNPDAKLATALLLIAQEHGFSSWRALKAEVERRGRPDRGPSCTGSPSASWPPFSTSC